MSDILTLAPDATHPGHDAKGRFAKGNKGGPGNQTARLMAEVRQLLFACVGPERFRALVERVYGWAMAGNLKAVKLLFEYTLGKPVPAAEADDLDRPAAEAATPPASPAVAAPVEAPAAPDAAAAPGLSPLARSVLRRAARRAAKKAAKAARQPG